jgi:hypothetical protein
MIVMFIKLNSINCKSSFISENEVLILNSNKLNIYDKKNLKLLKIIDLQINCSTVFKYKEKMFCCGEFLGDLYKIENNEVYRIEPEFLIYRNNYILNQNLILGYVTHNNGYSSEIFKIFSINEEKVLWESKNLNVRYCILADNIYVDHSERRDIPQCWNEIIKLSQNTGEILWKFDISSIVKELEVSRLVGVCDGILVAGIGEEYMIGINTENGELAWKQKAIPDFDIIDNAKGVLHSLTSGYVKRDIKNGEILDLFGDQDYFEKEAGIESQRDNYVLVGDHIITTDWRKGKIGAFNTITHRYDWIYEEAGVSFPAGQAMKYLEPHLFVMDSKQVLHIFEKE